MFLVMNCSNGKICIEITMMAMILFTMFCDCLCWLYVEHLLQDFEKKFPFTLCDLLDLIC